MEFLILLRKFDLKEFHIQPNLTIRIKTKQKVTP